MRKKDLHSGSTYRKFRKLFRHRTASALLLLAVFAMVLMVSLTPQKTQADSKKNDPKYKYFTSIQVSYGDTLWDIAKTYCSDEYSSLQSYIEEVKEINHLSSDKITEGMYLSIPYYSAEYKS